MKTIIYTTFDCLVKTPSWEKFVKEGENISLESLPENVYVYPTGKAKLIPFPLIPSQPAPFYKIIEKDDRRLIFLIDGLYVKSIDKHSFSYNGKTSEVEISRKEIRFSTKHTKKVITLPSECGDFKCGNAFHINYVIFSCKRGQLLILFNTLNTRIKTFEGQSIEQKEGDFIITSHNEGKTILYIDKDGLKMREKPKACKIFSNPLFIAKNFMEEIKNGEFDSALGHLSPQLQESQTASSLQEYFGEVSLIFPLDLYTIFALSSGKEKLYTFEIQNGKIVEISD
ncbi:MAG: hypothetical protein IJZ62_05025 [Clostridia bacterium]|nr:hypothetical protein [Clostridia bacterium]